MGPILEKFRVERTTLISTLFDLYKKGLQQKGYSIPSIPPAVRVTAQGGVGTAAEHQFLINNYNLDSVGWGSPFLLVPEATNVDDNTRQQLCRARVEDVVLSDISPLNVPFYSLKSSTKEQEKQRLIDKKRPGSACPKAYLELFNTEFTEKPICTASRLYQHYKIQALKQQNLDEATFEKKYNEVVKKSCICNGLGTSALLVNGLDTSREGEGVSICPGPNIVYFTEEVSLQDMVDHIYGRQQILKQRDRPHMFIKELRLYIDYFNSLWNKCPAAPSKKKMKELRRFRENLQKGIEYYRNLFEKWSDYFASLSDYRQILDKHESSLAVLKTAS